ncbi:hypothetical protein PBCVIL3A_112R [Paramecium bursaria Chlorella virus IL3A]|uniref:HNH nuclease domain-containing protein n=1 Tax=Paramecium bursaria Chlorella virus IL3A TaxID=46019 RepID=M1HUB3_PBCVI|nr:hypothetical protein PBCVIL3A_112R [Paramecium bursaria Chlorella virus IL3A]
MFHKIPNIVSKSGFTYEIDDDWTIVSISKNGNRTILKPNNDQVNISGVQYRVYNLAKLAGLSPKSWPVDEFAREWEELEMTSDVHGFRYRIFEDGQVQRMSQNGNVTSQTLSKTADGYYKVKISGKDKAIHRLFGVTKFVPKPPNAQASWTMHHKDNDPTNNHKLNLEWASLNTQNKERRHLESHSIRSCPVIGIALYDLTLKDGTNVLQGEEKKYDNAMKAANDIVGGNNTNISSCINGNLVSHAGFVWKVPPSIPELKNEDFKSIGAGLQYERFVSAHGRIKYTFHNGYSNIVDAKDMLTRRARRERDSYPTITISGTPKKVHLLVIEKFFGHLPKTININGKSHRLVIDHVDNVKTNARLGNLQILTQQENSKKRHIRCYTTSVASSFKGQYEYHRTRNDAIEYVRERGYPEATLDVLNDAIMLMEHENIPAKIYGRMWIRSHFENFS